MRLITARNLLAGIVIPAALLGSCTTPPGTGKARGIEALADDPRLGEKLDKVCFTSTIDGFRANGRDTVVLDDSPNRHYLVETTGGCINLDYAQSIAIDSKLSCIRKGDYLIVSDSAFSITGSTGAAPQRCLIKSLYAWDDDAVTEDEPEEE